jgi:hypothetical protein
VYFAKTLVTQLYVRLGLLFKYEKYITTSFHNEEREGDGCAIKKNSTHHFLLRVPVPSQDVER